MTAFGMIIRILVLAALCVWMGLAGIGQTYYEFTAHRLGQAAGPLVIHLGLCLYGFSQIRKILRYWRDTAN
jgi:hypothetical protein